MDERERTIDGGRRATIGDPDGAISLERRLLSVGIDAALLGAACATLLVRYTTIAGPRRDASGVVAGVLMATLFVLEVGTGLTPGKLVAGLRLAGANPSVRGARAVIKYAPIALFVIGLVASSPLTDLCWWTAAVVVQVYATVYYFAVARRGCSAFDLPVGTRVVRARRGTASSPA